MTMIRISTINIAILFVLSGVSFAEEQDNPILVEQGRCVEKDSTTAGISNCAYSAQMQWDAEMNKYYQLLLKKLDKESASKLRESQRAWVKFRDKEFEYLNFVYFKPLMGSVYTNTAAVDKAMIVEKRAKELKEYYRILTM